MRRRGYSKRTQRKDVVSESEEENVEEEVEETSNKDDEYTEEEEVEEEDEDFEQEDNEDDDDYEDRVTSSSRKRKRKSSATTAKKAQKTTATTGSSKKVRTGKAKIGTRKRKSSTAKTPSKKKDATKSTKKKKDEESVFIKNELKNSLFSIVRRDDAAISSTIDEWIDRYQADNMEGISELISFALQSSGCMTNFDGTEINSSSPEKILQNYLGYFPKDDVPDYPIISTHPHLKNFARNFNTFWDALIRGCKEEILYDGEMMEILLSWLSVLSSSKVRAFRHTGCLAMYTILDSLIDVCQNSVKKDLNKLEKQLDAEKKKSKNKTKKVAELSNQCTELQKHIIALEGHMTTVFKHVFALRYKDTAVHIRALSIESVIGWILNYPSKYLNNGILKYLGWALNDTLPIIRTTALIAIQKLYDAEDYHGELAAFSQKFLPRFLSVATKDQDVSTSVEAIKLLTSMLRFKIMVAPKHNSQIEQVTQLIFDENASVRYHAGVFLFHHLAKPLDKKQKARTTKKSKKLDVDLEDIIDFMRDNCEQCPLIAYYVAENLWKLTDTVKDWELMIDFLTEREEELQSEEDSLNLIRLLTASVQRVNDSLTLKTASTDNAKIPKSGAKKTKKTLEEEQRQEQEKMTGIVAAALPQLLQKYQAETEKMQELIQIPRQLNLEAYTEHHLQKDFEDMLKLLRDIFWKNTDPLTLRHIAQAFSYLLSVDYSLKAKAQTACDEIVRELVAKLQEAVSSIQNSDEDQETVTKDKNFAILVSLQRIREFSAVMKIDMDELYSDMSKIINAKIGGADIDNHSAKIILTILFQRLTWEAADIRTSKERDEILIELLIEQRDQFLNQVISILDLDLESTFELSLHAYYYLCDLFMYFAPLAPPKDKKQLDQSLIDLSMRLTIDLKKNQIDVIRNFVRYALKLELPDTVDKKDKEAIKKHNVQKQRVVVGLAKAICHSTASEKLADVLIANFVSHGAEVAEATKFLIQSLKKCDYSALWDHEFAAMCIKYEEYLTALEKESRKAAEKEFDEFVTLVNRLSLQHFWGHDDKHIALVIRMSIIYVFDEQVQKRYKFLQGLNKYAVKLGKDDASDLIYSLDEQMEKQDIEEKEVKDTIEDFRDLLKDVAEGNKKIAGKAKAGSKNKKKSAQKSDDEGEEQDEDIEISQDEDQREEAVTPVISRSQTPRRRRRRTAGKQLDMDDNETDENNQTTTTEEESTASDAVVNQEEEPSQETQVSQENQPSTTTEEEEEEDVKSRGTKRKRQLSDEDDETQTSAASNQEEEDVPEDEDIIISENPLTKKRKLA